MINLIECDVESYFVQGCLSTSTQVDARRAIFLEKHSDSTGWRMLSEYFKYLCAAGRRKVAAKVCCSTTKTAICMYSWNQNVNNVSGWHLYQKTCFTPHLVYSLLQRTLMFLENKKLSSDYNFKLILCKFCNAKKPN